MDETDILEVANEVKGGATIQDRIAAFRMLDSMAEATQAQKALRLSLVGFNRIEIASLLQTTPQSVSQALYLERKKGQRGDRSTKSSRTRKAKVSNDAEQDT